VSRDAGSGRTAGLSDVEGALRPVHELLAEALSVARRHAGELACTDELELLPRLLEREGGAGRQRRFHGLAGMDALLRELTLLTAG
jgi:gamma-glutamyl:cysteine ligase YbdK (ATP-grasp superfamily)